jgi:Holliday junction resolvasome RuvABC endonuclease subunit
VSIIVGIDPSLTHTGVAFCSKNSDGSVCIHGKTHGITRIDGIVSEVSFFLANMSPDLVVIEGPSYGSVSSAIFELGELCGVLQKYFFDHNIPYIIPSPSEAKKVAAGSGNADKSAIKKAVVQLYNLPDNLKEHEYDAYSLVYYGEQFMSYVRTGNTAYPQVSGFMDKILLKERLRKRTKKEKGKVINPKYYLPGFKL